MLPVPVVRERNIKNAAANLLERKRPVKRQHLSWRLCLLFFTFFLCAPPLLSAEGGKPTAEPVTNEHAGETEQPAVEAAPVFVEIYRHVNEIPKRIVDLDDILENTVDADAVDRELPPMEKEIEDLAWQITLEKSNPSLTYTRLAALVAKVDGLKKELESLQDPVTDSLNTLALQEKFWEEEKERLDSYLEMAEKDASLRLIFAEKKKLLQTVEKALRQVNTRLQAVIDVSRELNDLLVRLYEEKSDLQGLIQDVRSIHIQQTSPSVLSAKFYRLIDLTLLQDSSWHKAPKVFRQQLRFFVTNGWMVLSVLACISLLSVGLACTGRMVTKRARWYSFTRRPVATVFFLGLSLFLLAGILLSIRHFTVEVENMLYIVTISAAIRLAGVLVDRWLYRHLLLPIAFFLILSLLLQMFHMPGVIVHLYIFWVSLFQFFLSISNILRNRKRISSLNLFLLSLLGLVCLVIGAAEIAGYSAVALYLFHSFLYSVIAALVFWMLFQVMEGLLELLFSRMPIALLKKNSSVLVRQFVPVLVIAFSLMFFLISLVIWQAYPTVEEAAKSFSNFGFFIGSFKVTPGYLLLVAMVIYGSLLFSRGLQALLLQEVLPRSGAEIGVQLSITRLVHYAVLVVGFLVLLRILGLELTRLALLGGALGVGIGFGLQAIVNNFASGLILLFERPLKVGDMIQVGTDMGEVKKLGLRATVVRTFDNADIVIPNSDLITGQVTNWTLADRHIRVKVPVGVAYGSDISRVLEILLACAEANPMVLSRPKPRALFLAFGASSLDFELRVWITDFTDRRQVLSELNQDIEAEFSTAGIEIPFPQADIHFRSVDTEVVEKMGVQRFND